MRLSNRVSQHLPYYVALLKQRDLLTQQIDAGYEGLERMKENRRKLQDEITKIYESCNLDVSKNEVYIVHEDTALVIFAGNIYVMPIIK